MQSDIVTIWFGCIKITCRLYVSWHFCDCILETNRTDHPTCITAKLCKRCHACYQCQAYFYHWEAVLWAHCLEQHWKVEECTKTTQAWSIPHSSSWKSGFSPNAKSLAVAAVLHTMLLRRAMRCVCHRWHQQGRHIGSWCFFPHCQVHSRPTRNSGTELTLVMCCVPLETATEPYSEAVNYKFWILGWFLVYSDNALWIRVVQNNIPRWVNQFPHKFWVRCRFVKPWSYFTPWSWNVYVAMCPMCWRLWSLDAVGRLGECNHHWLFPKLGNVG